MGRLLDRLERRRARGQALVEFSLTIVIFLVLMMAIVDLGRGIYMFNGVSEAAREIARVTSVHPGTAFGNSAADGRRRRCRRSSSIPNLGDPTFTCVDMTDTVVPLDVNGRCEATKGNRVRVTVVAPYKAVTPLLGLIGTVNMQSTTSLEIP